MRNCSNCPYRYDALSDVCDSCAHTSDTGWYGYTDYSVSDENGYSPHFYNEEEQERYYDEADEASDGYGLRFRA